MIDELKDLRVSAIARMGYYVEDIEKYIDGCYDSHFSSGNIDDELKLINDAVEKLNKHLKAINDLTIRLKELI